MTKKKSLKKCPAGTIFVKAAKKCLTPAQWGMNEDLNKFELLIDEESKMSEFRDAVEVTDAMTNIIDEMKVKVKKVAKKGKNVGLGDTSSREAVLGIINEDLWEIL